MTTAGVTLPTDRDLASITALTQELVRVPSQGGIDAYGPVVEVLAGWLRRAGLRPVVLMKAGEPVAVVCTVDSGRPGRHLVLDGCLDTAAAGDPGSWDRPMFSGDLEHGWLHGRGAADSKGMLALFAHLLADLQQTGRFTGQVTLLADLDEHTGGFAGIKQFLAQVQRPVDGVMIGYPGCDNLVIGGRGCWRARITVHGRAAHTGSSSRVGVNALTRTTRLMSLISEAVPEDVDPRFGLPAKVSFTSLQAGTPSVWSVVPDRAELEVDIRTTPTVTAGVVQGLVRSACFELDQADPMERATSIERLSQAWPAFQVPADHWLVTGLLEGARAAGLSPRLKVAGPSNIGCYLSDVGIPATAGFGPRHRGLHAADEAIEVASLASVYAAYMEAVTAS